MGIKNPLGNEISQLPIEDLQIAGGDDRTFISTGLDLVSYSASARLLQSSAPRPPRSRTSVAGSRIKFGYAPVATR